LEQNNLFEKPEQMFNEKGCQLNLHKEPEIFAQKEVKRVHIIGKWCDGIMRNVAGTLRDTHDPF